MQEYKQNKNAPFAHNTISNICRPGFLEHVLGEVKQNTKVQFKESDLFKVYQSIDLANLQSDDSETQTKFPHLLELKASLYSPQFRRFMENICDLKPDTFTDQVDCAANCHTQGCHLLCHDDVIGTRKVSYILYLTDPDPLWTERDGGVLELYDSSSCLSTTATTTKTTTDDSVNVNVSNVKTMKMQSKREPNAFPCKTILPTFNNLAYFEVKPGESFHSVQEVFCDRPRLSIQGWYHAKEAPENFDHATLSRLKSTKKGEDTEVPFRPYHRYDECNNKDDNAVDVASNCNSQAVPCLTESEQKHLQKYINDIYLKKESICEIRTRFEGDSSVQLRHFLNFEWEQKIKDSTASCDQRDGFFRRPTITTGANTCSSGEKEHDNTTSGSEALLSYEVGRNDNWKAIGPSHKQRFLEYLPGEERTNCDNNNNSENSSSAKFECNEQTTDAGALMQELRTNVFESTAFARFMNILTSLGDPTGHRGHIRRFRPGMDYTVAHYGILTQSAVLDASLCFVAGKGEQCLYDEQFGDLIGDDEDAVWESGDVGGFECYIAADDNENENNNNDGPDDEYNADDDTELLSVAASNNTLSLVYRDPGTMRFIKYVASGAPSSRWDLSFEYEVEDDSDDSSSDVEEVDLAGQILVEPEDGNGSARKSE